MKLACDYQYEVDGADCRMSWELPVKRPTVDGELCTIVTFDLETTGLGSKAEIVQIAAVSDTGLSFCEYIKAKRKMDEKASEVTGITEETLKDADPARPVLLRFKEWLSQFPRIVLVAHNGEGLDFPVFIRELYNNDIPMHDLTVAYLHDSLKFFRTIPDGLCPLHPKTGKPTRAQEYLYAHYFEQKIEGAHDALVDAWALMRLVLFKEDPFEIRLEAKQYAVDKSKELMGVYTARVKDLKRKHNPNPIMDFFDAPKRAKVDDDDAPDANADKVVVS